MLCPVCKVGLSMSERQGIEVDYCPQCRGVWLDRGELDKIIERSDETPKGGGYRHDSSKHEYDKYNHKGHKRKSLLGELFDF